MALIWGVTWLPTKIAVQTVPPIFLATARFLLSGVLFLVILRIRRLPLRIPAFGRIVAASLLITTGCYSFVFWGVAHASSGLSAIVNLSLMPIFLAFIGSLYGQEHLSAHRVGAIDSASSGSCSCSQAAPWPRKTGPPRCLPFRR